MQRSGEQKGRESREGRKEGEGRGRKGEDKMKRDWFSVSNTLRKQFITFVPPTGHPGGL